MGVSLLSVRWLELVLLLLGLQRFFDSLRGAVDYIWPETLMEVSDA